MGTMPIAPFRLAVFVLALASASKPLYFEVNAGREECIYEEYKAEEKIDFYFEVTQGGDLDIELKIFGPKKNMMLQRMASFKDDFSQAMGEVGLRIDSPGVHKFCFN